MKQGGSIMHKQNFNFHTHTMRCGHAEGLDIQYVQSAIDAGFTQLGFSDHIPYINVQTPESRMSYEQKDEYIASIRKLQQQFKDQIDIKLGYEVEYIDHNDEFLMEMKKDVDYMILGQHLKYIDYEYDCYCSDEDVLIYTQQIEDALEKNFITYVAHPDYFMLGRRQFSPVCEEAAHRIAQASLRYDTPLEINLNGFHYGKKTYYFEKSHLYDERYPYPFREFWEIISSYGCKIIYGYDAHSPIAFLEADRLIKAQDILKDIPLHFIDTIQFK